jgi:hypothetical protein
MMRHRTAPQSRAQRAHAGCSPGPLSLAMLQHTRRSTNIGAPGRSCRQRVPAPLDTRPRCERAPADPGSERPRSTSRSRRAPVSPAWCERCCSRSTGERFRGPHELSLLQRSFRAASVEQTISVSAHGHHPAWSRATPEALPFWQGHGPSPTESAPGACPCDPTRRWPRRSARGAPLGRIRGRS